MMNLPVVVGITDGQNPGVIEYACEEAIRLDRPLRIVHVVEDARAHEAVRERFSPELQDRLLLVPSEEVTLFGSAEEVLLREAESASCLVLGPADPDPTSPHWSEVARHVALHAAVPVIVLPTSAVQLHHLHVLLALDMDHFADGQIAYAIEAAQLRGTGLNVVFAAGAGSDYPHRMAHVVKLEDILDPWRARHPDVSIRVLVEGGQVVNACVAAGSHATLMVLGQPRTKRLSLESWLVGSRILHRAVVPVAVVPFDYLPTPAANLSTP